MLINCEAELAIDLKGERVKLVSFEGIEELGKPFEINLDVLSETAELDLLPCMGNEGCVTIRQDTEVLRNFHGILTEGRFVEPRYGGFLHRLTLRPRSFLMDHNSDYRIFQEKSALDIIQDTLQRNGQVATANGVQGGKTKRNYCVQYGESDFAFISRLMEEEGIYYYYEHASNDHKMVMCDQPSAHHDGDPDKLIYDTDLTGQIVFASDKHLGLSNFAMSWEERVATGSEAKVTYRDFNYEETKVLQVFSQAQGVHKADALEVYAFPGDYQKDAEGTPLTHARLDALRARRQIFAGECLTPAICYGTRFTLTKHPNDRYDNKNYLFTRIHMSLFNSTYQTGEDEVDDFVNFEAVKSDTPWRTLPVTPRPVVRGPETAIITGPEKEEIFTDKFGRVKVRFHWDRSGSKDEESTCWMRVSQTGGLGNIILPRVGHEVVVDFLDGNPDRPLVVGRVFNSAHMPIYDLPANKTIALWRTRRYGDTGSYGDAKDLDTGKPGVNELRFEDKGGKEEIFLHAERDMKTRIRHQESHHVGLDRELIVHGNETRTVDKDEKIAIHGNETKTIDKDDTVTIHGSKTVTIDKDETRNTKGNVTIKADANHDEKVKGNYSLDVTGKLSIKANQIEIEGQLGITLKVGGSTIKIDPMQIKSEAMMIGIAAQIQTEIKGLMISVQASALTQVKGAIVLIN